MSSSFDKSRSRRTKKRNSNFCSTPLVNQAHRLSSISISAVDTNSSSSNKNVSVITKLIERKKKIKSKKQKRKTKQQPKKDTDSDWETKSEQSVYGETLLRDSIKKTISNSDDDVLFKDITSPERVRDAPRLAEDHLESPILRFNQWQTESPKRISIGKEDALPLKEFPFRVRLDDSDDDEHTLILSKENAVKTYLGVRHVRQSKKNVSIEKCKQWLVNVSVPTTSSDLLWDDFVKNNYEKVKKYLAPSSNSKQRSSKYEHHKGNGDDTTKKCDHEEQNVQRLDGIKDFPLHVGENMQVVRGYCNKSSRKWVRTYEEYNFSEHGDDELKKENETRSRMGLNEYLRKCRVEKEKMKEKSSFFKSKQSVSVMDSKETRKKSRKKSVSDFKSDEKRSKVLPENVLDSKSICNEMSLGETPVPTAPSRLKRVNEHDTNGTENVTKRRRINANYKPNIKTIELLTTLQYDKDKNMWQRILD